MWSTGFFTEIIGVSQQVRKMREDYYQHYGNQMPGNQLQQLSQLQNSAAQQMYGNQLLQAQQQLGGLGSLQAQRPGAVMQQQSMIDVFYGFAPLRGSYGNDAQGPSRTAGQGNQRSEQREEIRKAFEGDIPKDELQARIAAGKERLTLKNSPIFGEPAFGRWCRWTFCSPFAPLKRWFLRQVPAIRRWAST